ncbi:uncharacterized protein LOC142825959 [Pelodiscus sinensis]|uniref:uncharacterized protein LOC142825959 n=1 Tax=Pelodiscus sinensis TaxID=13735 RepID=UPI003F6C0F0F
MGPQFLPLALGLLAATPMGAQEGQEVTVEAGSNVSLPCNLTGPQLTWKWIPRYPRCAGVSSGIQEIYTVTTAGVIRSLLERFKNWLGLQSEPGTQTSVLTLQLTQMNASGVFFCASGSQNSTPISVTVTPGCPAGASIQGAPERPVRRGASVSLSCAPCGEKGPRPAPAGGATWLIDGTPLSDPTALRILRGNKVTLKDFSGQYEGLWSCRLPGDPPRSGSYCLELDPGAPGIQPTRPPSRGQDRSAQGRNLTPPLPPNSLLPVIGGCVGAVLTLTLMAAAALIYLRRRQPRRASATPVAMKIDGQWEQAAEQPSPPEAGEGKQNPPACDPQPGGEGPEGICYASLSFQQPPPAGGRGKTGPTTIYSELAPRHGQPPASATDTPGSG